MEAPIRSCREGGTIHIHVIFNMKLHVRSISSWEIEHDQGNLLPCRCAVCD